MFKFIGNIVSATAKVAIGTPLGVVADVVTLGGVLADRDESYTESVLKSAAEDFEDALD